MSTARTITFNGPTQDSSVTTALNNGSLKQAKYNTFMANLQTSLDAIVEYFHWFFGVYDRTFSVKVVYDGSVGWGAQCNSSTLVIKINIYYAFTTVELIRSTMVHEIGHALMKRTDSAANKTNIIKFMEFMTNAPCANWKWAGSHNYPCISSQYYSEVDDALTFTAYNVSRLA